MVRARMVSAEWQDLVGMVAGVIGLAAFVPYLVSTVRGHTRPNRASWLIWALVGGVLAASDYAAGAGPSVWVPVSYVVGPLVAVVFALKYGEGGWTRFDGACLVGSGLSLGLWLVSSSPLVALVANIAIDAFGALPTVRKAWRAPRSEDPVAWSMFLAANTLNLAAVPVLKFEVLLYPVYLVAVSIGVTTPLLREARAGRRPRGGKRGS